MTARAVLKADSTRNLGSRTLMYFKGCPRLLGCTIILKGASTEELTQVKPVMQVSYSGRRHMRTAGSCREEGYMGCMPTLQCSSSGRASPATP